MDRTMICPPANEIDDAIIKLLLGAPQQWTVLDEGEMTAVEEEALKRLSGAAMIERRFSFRLSLISHSAQLEATVTVTGEHGLLEAIEPVLRQAWELWAAFYREQQAKAPEDKPRLHCEKTGPTMWRLTLDGVQAVADLAMSNHRVVLDYVQKRTEVFYGMLVRGHGCAERIEQIRPDPTPAGVEITNLGEVAGPLAEMATMMQRMFEKLSCLGLSPQAPPPLEQQPAVTSEAPNGPKRGTRGPERMQPVHAWRYLSTVQAWMAVQELNRGKPQRQRERKDAFARGQDISVEELNAMLSWYRKYHRQGLFPPDPRTLTRDKLDELFA